MTEAERGFAGLRVVFTGRLASMRRDEARALVARAGGEPAGNVSRRTDVLVVGMQGWPVLPDGSISRKLAAAERLREAGAQLEILSEHRFLERLGLREPAPSDGGSCSLERAASILGVPERQLARWQQLGLVHGDEAGLLRYRELVSLRQIAALLREGVPLTRLSRAMERLRDLLQLEAPLSQVRVLEHNGQLLAELEGTRFDPAGQLELFDHTLQALSEPLEAWFDYAADCEEEGRWLEAEAAYRRVLVRDPDFAEAHFNLGNIYRARGQYNAAAAAYRRAARDPELAAPALYNLGYVLDEQGRHAEAVRALRRALRRDPSYADAWFNLALCYEALRDPARAAEAWRRYLALDSGSEWSRQARRHLFLAERAGREPPRG